MLTCCTTYRTQPWEFLVPLDYVHTHMTAGVWGDYKTELIDQSFAGLRPGGWLESQERTMFYESADGSLPADSALHKWVADLDQASRILNRPLNWAVNLRRWYEEAGFVDVHELIFRIPSGPWPSDPQLEELGAAWQSCVLDSLSGLSVYMFNEAFNRSQETTEVMLTQVRKELLDPTIHAWNNVYVVWGRKPYPDEVQR